MSTPAAGLFMAAMVGFRQRVIARPMRPPLYSVRPRGSYLSFILYKVSNLSVTIEHLASSYLIRPPVRQSYWDCLSLAACTYFPL